MAKSKNHTAHNQQKKWHRNGIKKVQEHKYSSKKGMHQTYLRNLRRVQKGNAKALAAKKQ